MIEQPCKNCKYYQIYNGYYSCFGVSLPEFYLYEDIDLMMKNCPRGFRALKKGKTNFTYYRDYEKAKKI